MLHLLSIEYKFTHFILNQILYKISFLNGIVLTINNLKFHLKLIELQIYITGQYLLYIFYTIIKIFYNFVRKNIFE